MASELTRRVAFGVVAIPVALAIVLVVIAAVVIARRGPARA